MTAILADHKLQGIFSSGKDRITIWILLCKVCSQGYNQQYFNTGSDNGLALNRRQAIILTNADPVHWRIYAALGGYDSVSQQILHKYSLTNLVCSSLQHKLGILWILYTMGLGVTICILL